MLLIFIVHAYPVVVIYRQGAYNLFTESWHHAHRALLHARMTVSTSPSLRLIECLNHLEGSLLIACYHHLCDTLAIVDDEILGREVHQQHHYLAPIVCINRARCIEYRDSMLQ